jgi:hypothetical protein
MVPPKTAPAENEPAAELRSPPLATSAPAGRPKPVFDLARSTDVARHVRAKFRRCWTNAACSVALLGEEGRYVEGWIVVNRQHPVVIEHGWCEVDGCIIDPTYTPYVSHLEPPLAYVGGMYFSANEAAAALQRGTLPIAWLRATSGYEAAFKKAWMESARHGDSEPRPKTRVVNCRLEDSELLIGRPSKWHNPFHIGPDGTREEVVAKYRQWIIRQPRLLRDLRSLRGRVLGCDCPPLPCHGDVLAELADLGF